MFVGCRESDSSSCVFAVIGIGSLVIVDHDRGRREQVSGVGVPAGRRPAKFVWQILPIILMLVCGVVGGIMGLIWYTLEARTRLRAPRSRAVRRRTDTARLRSVDRHRPPCGWPPPPTWRPPSAPPHAVSAARAATGVAAVASRSHERRHPAISRRGSRRGSRRPARAAGPHALARPDPGIGLGLRHRPRVSAGLVRVLADEVRLARAGRPVQPLAALPHRHRRPADPLHPRALRRSRRVAVDHHARLAGIGRRVPRRHRAARASQFHVVVPSLPGYGWSGPTTRTRLGREARRGSVGDVDGAPRLRPLRRAGRRLGRDDLGPARGARPRARGRAAQQHAAGVPRRRERHRAQRRRRTPTSPRPPRS